MTAFADGIYDVIIAHDQIATVLIMTIVLGIVVLWLRAGRSVIYEEPIERARLTVALLPERWSKGA